VLDAGITSAVPFRGTDWMRVVSRYGHEKGYFANQRDVNPGYFSVMRLTLLRGRLFTDRDTSSSERVVVVSESFARQAFPAEEPIGRQLDIHGPRTIVGIVKDVRYQGLDRAPVPAIYIPKAQDPSELVCLVLRTSGKREAMAAMLRQVVHEIDPTIPVLGITTIDKIVSDSVADRRFYTTTIAAFAALALLLTASGLVVIARSVAERRRELAIRSALGAESGQLVSLVIRQGLLPVILGTSAGLLLAWLGARILEQFLFEVKLHDPLVYCGVGVFTIAVAALACFLPARRVGDLQPAIVLQSE
jgi:putative ABC transport system permease protein